MRKNKGPDTKPCKTPVLNLQLDDELLYKVTLWCLLWKTIQLGQDDYHLFHYSLVYTDNPHAKPRLMLLISLLKPWVSTN